ncbi:MAG: glycosyl hydrolase family 18 protein, partial [Acidimicrobiales bacterium]
MGPRGSEQGGAGQVVRLLHPARGDARLCRVDVGRRGLVLRPLRPSGRRVRVPWWAVQGFDADGTAPGPDGSPWQVLGLVTDAGTLSLQLPASELSVLLARVGRSAGRWRRARRPAVAASRRIAALATATVAVPLGSLVVNALGDAGLGVAGWLAPLLRVPLLRVPLRAVARRPMAAGVTGLTVAVVAVVLAVAGAQPVPTLPSARAAVRHGFDASGMAKLALAAARGTSLDLAAATAAPAPAPPSVADQPPLRPHEVFGFAPYWNLDQSAGFPVQGLTTIAYFSLDVNADGSLVQSGPGWDGYQSRALADLVTRAHAAGDRVVLTVDDFAQASLDQLTSSPPAATTLASAVVSAVQAKNLDGVNLDFEGAGSADQAGLTALVGTVAAAVHHADPHYQVTMDTYASAAGDPTGFYDVRALAPEVDGLFVMAYDLNLRGAPSAGSPLTSAMFSDQSALAQYTAAVPASKVLFGLPYYGYDWPTTDGTMSATAVGTPTPVPTSQLLGAGHTIYWDPVTQTAWTAYQSGGQWHEAYFEDPTSLYQATQLARSYGVGGVGAWALGMDGNDAQVIGALNGVAPPVDAVAGPLGTPGT